MATVVRRVTFVRPAISYHYHSRTGAAIGLKVGTRQQLSRRTIASGKDCLGRGVQ